MNGGLIIPQETGGSIKKATINRGRESGKQGESQTGNKNDTWHIKDFQSKTGNNQQRTNTDMSVRKEHRGTKVLTQYYNCSVHKSEEKI